MTKQFKTLFVLSAMATISSLSISGNVDAATINTQSSINAVASVKETDGWKQKDGKWYYYDNGTLLKNKWFTVSGNTYYATSNGAIKTGWLESYGPSSDGKTKYWFYFNKNGKMLTGLQKIGTAYYYFNKKENENIKGPKGTMICCDSYDDFIVAEVDNTVHAFGSNGKALKGWKYFHDCWYYFSESGTATDGIKTIGGKKYVFVYDNRNCETITNQPKNIAHLAKNQWILVANNGSIISKYYANSDGMLATKGWKQIDTDKITEESPWYYFDANGRVATGWQKIGGKWYFFNTYYKNSSYVINELLAFGNAKTAYIKESANDWYDPMYGALLMNGAYSFKNNSYGENYVTYGFSKTGAMITGGWTKIDDQWFYFKSNGEAAKGLQILPINNKSTVKDKFYLDDRYGKIITGIIYIDGKKYYFKPSTGRMSYGWVKSANGWMYFDKVHDGAALTSVSKKIGGKTYNFDKNGYCTNP